MDEDQGEASRVFVEDGMGWDGRYGRKRLPLNSETNDRQNDYGVMSGSGRPPPHLGRERGTSAGLMNF